MKTVILAGGLGTRISEESYLKPKPMIEIGGAPILWHIMKYYSHFGFNEFVICCGYKGYLIKEYFAHYYLHSSDVTFDFPRGGGAIIHNNNVEPWRVTLVDTGLETQTGGRVARVAEHVGDTFMLTYGDGVGNVDLKALLDRHRRLGTKATLTAVRPGGRFGVGDLDEDKDHITGFREKAKEDINWINAGFMVMEPSIFEYLSGDECVLEQTPMDLLANERALGVYKHDGFWQCMDTLRDKTYLEELLKKGEAPWRVW